MIDVKRPRLLDSSLNETAVLKPLGLQLTLQTPGVSTAVLTLNPNDPEPQMHSWIELYNQNGSVGVFRVTSPTTDYAQQSTITLRHGIDSFADSVLKTQEEFSGTPTQLLTRMIAAQTTRINGAAPWALGTVAANSTIKMSLNYNRLSDLLENLEEELEGYYFEYDQSAFPWVINVKAAPSNADCEFRLNRNVMTINRTLNDNDLCTQLILSINNKTTTDEITSAKSYIKTYNNATAQATYGIVQKTADIDTDDDLTVTTEQPIPDTPEADAWAARFLADHAAPTIQLQISAKELKRITGDTWDETKLGHMCRVALPSHSQTFTERVVNVTYPDALGQPDVVNVSLANQLPKFSSSIASLRAENSRLSRSTRRVARSSATVEEQEYWEKKVRYHGEALDGTGVTTLYESGIEMSPTGGVKIYSLQEGVQALYSGITVNANAITLETTRASEAEGTLSGRITVEAGKISQIVSAVGDDGEVTAASIVAAINDGSSSVVISADHIELDGDTVAAILYGKQVEVNEIDAEIGDVGELDIETRLAVNGTASFVGSATFQDVDIQDGLTVDAITLNGRSVNVVDASASGNVLTITKADGSTVTFSKATTLSGGWSSGVFTVDATQNNVNVGSYTTTITQGSTTWSGTTATVPIVATDSTSGGYSYNTGRNISVDASGIAGIDTLTKNAESTNPRDYDSWSGTSIGTLSEDTYYQIKATPNAGSSAFIKFKTAASSGGQGGIASVTAGGWTWANNTYTNTVTAVANDGTSDTVGVTLPTISCQVGTGTSDNATIRPYGPGDHILPTGTSLTLYLKSDDNYVYLTNANATPAVGTNVVARATNTKAGPETVTITSATRTAQGDDATVISGTDGTLGSAGYKYFVVTATASNGATRTIGINAEPTYTAGYNAAPVGLLHNTNLLTWSASSNDSSVYSGWSSVDSISTGGYQYRQYYVTAANGDTAYIKVNASTTYTAGYNAAPVGIPNDCCAHVGYSNDASDYADWTTSDTLSMSSYKYKLITVVANDGTQKYVKIHADGTYNAGYYNALANGGNEISLGSSTSYSNVGMGHDSRNVTGYIWYKDSSGTWQRMKNANGTYRSFSINATNLSARVYRINSDDEYEPYPAGNLIWTW